MAYLLDPDRAVIARATLRELAVALDLEPMEYDGRVYFCCPACGSGRRGGNLGSASADATTDARRWRCHRCRHEGTRHLLEHLALCSGSALDWLHEQQGDQ